MGLMRPKDHFLTLSRRPSPWGDAQATPSPQQADGIAIGNGGFSVDAIANLRLADFAVADKLPAPPAATPKKESVRTPAPRKEKLKGSSFIDRPLTLRRSWKFKAFFLSPVILLAGGALADKYTGGAVMLNTVDASVAAADYTYRHIKGGINIDDAVEWGVAIAQPLKFLHTDPTGLWAKNEAALEARHKHNNDAQKVKEAVLPVLFTVDYKSIIANYTLRNAITLRNYPDMNNEDRGQLLARGFLRDVHQSFEAASELSAITLSDNDILHYFARRPEMMRRMPADLRKGLGKMIGDMLRAERGLPPVPTQPHQLQDWQIAALEASAAAEMGPPETAAERQRREAEMDRAMRAAEEAARPKTLGEIMAEQNRRTPQPRVAPSPQPRPALTQRSGSNPSRLREQMQTATERARTRAAETAAKVAPSPWRAGWCSLKGSVVTIRYDKCLLGQ